VSGPVFKHDDLTTERTEKDSVGFVDSKENKWVGSREGGEVKGEEWGEVLPQTKIYDYPHCMSCEQTWFPLQSRDWIVNLVVADCENYTKIMHETNYSV